MNLVTGITQATVNKTTRPSQQTNKATCQHNQPTPADFFLSLSQSHEACEVSPLPTDLCSINTVIPRHAYYWLCCKQVGRLLHKACCSVRAGMAPDEFIVITALRQRGFVRSVQRVEVKPNMRYPPGCLLNSYPTFVVFPAESSPHPVLWTHPDEKVKCQVRQSRP